MTDKEKIIERFKRGFGIFIPYDTKINITSSEGGDNGSWHFVQGRTHEIRANAPMSECLKWKRWAMLGSTIYEYKDGLDADTYTFEAVTEEEIAKKLEYINETIFWSKYGFNMHDRLVLHKPFELTIYKPDEFNPLFNFLTMTWIIVNGEGKGTIMSHVGAHPYWEFGQFYQNQYIRGQHPQYSIKVTAKHDVCVEEFSEQIKECVNGVMADYEKIVEEYGSKYGITQADFGRLREFLYNHLTHAIEDELRLGLALREDMKDNGKL